MTAKKKKMKSKKRIWLFLVLILISVMVISSAIGWSFYKELKHPNVSTNREIFELNVPTGSNLNDLIVQLKAEDVVIDSGSFRLVANLRKFSTVKPGKYFVQAGINNWDLVAMFRIGERHPVTLVVGSYRNRQDLVRRVSRKLELDSNTLGALLEDPVFLRQYGLNAITSTSVIIPNSYEFYWNTNATDFFERMLKEYEKFWDDAKSRKADSLGLTRLEVLTLASIIQEETRKTDEMNRIAGVYLNRLKKNWLLQADPTLKYAANDWTIRRVLRKHQKIDSPYNTYKYKGLPPSPICIAAIPAILAALNPEVHNYMYFCAKEDFSGYHNFATNLREHNRNARKFQAALNKKKIYR